MKIIALTIPFVVAAVLISLSFPIPTKADVTNFYSVLEQETVSVGTTDIVQVTPNVNVAKGKPYAVKLDIQNHSTSNVRITLDNSSPNATTGLEIKQGVIYSNENVVIGANGIKMIAESDTASVTIIWYSRW